MRSFTNTLSKSDASYESWNWDTDSMKNFHFDSIICASKDHNIVGAISKPSDWPSLKFYSSKLLLRIQDFLNWRLNLVKLLKERSS